MIAKLIEFSLNNRALMILLAVVILALGFWAANEIAVDAIPDLSDVQVIIQTEYGGQPPQVVEDQITYPLSSALLSVPGAKHVRGYSYFGLSFVYIIFEDGTDIYWARSRVLEYLSQIAPRLPQGVNPQLGPDATGVGWVYQYALVDTTGKHDLAELRSLQDWFLKYELTALEGVAEVASVGGFVRQFQVEVNPLKLEYYGLNIAQVSQAVKKAGGAVGGRLLELGETEFMVRSQAYIGDLEDLRNLPIAVPFGSQPVLLSDVADVHYGPEIRRGVAELDGKGETVGGIVVIRYGENAREVINRVTGKLAELEPGLPDGVKIIPVYDRSGLIDRATSNLRLTLVKEIIVVVIISFLFLLHLRSTLVAAIILPAGVGLSLLIMHLAGINANIMSLGGIAIAIGVMVDASIVMVENAHKHLEKATNDAERRQAIGRAAVEVGPALFFSLLIITVSFLPILALEGQSGRLFRPLAYTKTFAMAASALLSVTVIPALMALFLKGKVRTETRNYLSRFFIAVYRPVIDFVLKFRWLTLIAAVIALLVSVYPALELGSEFMPPLYEGDLLYMPTTLPGISISKARELLQQTDRIIATFPEVERVFGKAGRAETVTDPAPLTMLETTIKLKPQEEWRSGMTPEKLIDSLDAAIQIPGLTNAWTMPIRTRIDMLETGIKTPVGIKIMGTDLDTLYRIAKDIEKLMTPRPGVRSVYAERLTGGNYLDIDIDRFRAASYGLTVDDINRTIASAVGGMNVAENIEGRERYPINVRYLREFRDTPEAIKNVLVALPSGGNIRLGQVAEVGFTRGAAMIKTENGRPTAWIFVDLKESDIGTFVKEARRDVAAGVDLPAGYSVIWSGQYENMQEAAARLRVIVPLTIFVILLLLYIHFKGFKNTLIIVLSLPLALVGGIWFIYLSGFNLSVAVYVGFIALAGLAAETGIVMLVYLQEALDRYRANGHLKNLIDLRGAVTEGAVERVRPKIMTVATTIIALLPIMYGHGTGSETMRRIAAPMVGGMVSSTVLTLIVVPVLFYLLNRREVTKNQ